MLRSSRESFFSISSEHNKPTGRVDKEKNRKKRVFHFFEDAEIKQGRRKL